MTKRKGGAIGREVDKQGHVQDKEEQRQSQRQSQRRRPRTMSRTTGRPSPTRTSRTTGRPRVKTTSRMTGKLRAKKRSPRPLLPRWTPSQRPRQMSRRRPRLRPGRTPRHQPRRKSRTTPTTTPTAKNLPRRSAWHLSAGKMLTSGARSAPSRHLRRGALTIYAAPSAVFWATSTRARPSCSIRYARRRSRRVRPVVHAADRCDLLPSRGAQGKDVCAKQGRL
mgnify:CR=1 FL=1